jgi:flagellar biosynthesis GTPase FlhF
VRLHLVLNGAYEYAVLLRQARAFRSCLPIEDVSFTHLDESEDPRKIIEIGLGINCSIRFLSGGQNIPGRLQEFRPDTAIAS